MSVEELGNEILFYRSVIHSLLNLLNDKSTPTLSTVCNKIISDFNFLNLFETKAYNYEGFANYFNHDEGILFIVRKHHQHLCQQIFDEIKPFILHKQCNYHNSIKNRTLTDNERIAYENTFLHHQMFRHKEKCKKIMKKIINYTERKGGSSLFKIDSVPTAYPGAT